MGAGAKLQVQIVAFGQEGIERVASHNHPVVSGVRWLVSLQMPTGEEPNIPESILSREDFDIIVHHDRGVSLNRNHALDYPSDAPYVLFGDDDVDYHEHGLKDLIEAFESNPSADIICCRYTSNGEYIKNYGSGIFSIRKPPKGWYIATFEVAFRRNFSPRVRFNENISIGAKHLICGEDSLWFRDMLHAGAQGLGMPIDLCEHNGPTTSERHNRDSRLYFAKGAISTREHPVTWAPRLLARGLRAPIPYLSYLRHTFSGALFALRTGILRPSFQK